MGNCKDCKWWRRKGPRVWFKTSLDGWCNRFPETEIKHQNAWCGEFKAKETKPSPGAHA